MRDLAVAGDDIMACFGVPQGQHVGQLLKIALNAVIDGVVENDHDVILNYLLQNYQLKYENALNIEVNSNGKC